MLLLGLHLALTLEQKSMIRFAECARLILSLRLISFLLDKCVCVKVVVLQSEVY